MNHDRLHALTDGIFAIVMTLMVLELKVPNIDGTSNAALWGSLKGQSAILISYVISFALLLLYWRAHNFIISTLAKNIDINLQSINGLFLFLIGLVPFSTHLLGSYPDTPLAHCVYAGNVVLIGLTLIGMRTYIDESSTIESLERTREQRLAAFARVMNPVLFSAAAIPISFYNTNVSFGIFIFAIIFNFHSNAGGITLKLLRFARVLR